MTWTDEDSAAFVAAVAFCDYTQTSTEDLNQNRHLKRRIFAYLYRSDRTRLAVSRWAATPDGIELRDRIDANIARATYNAPRGIIQRMQSVRGAYLVRYISDIIAAFDALGITVRVRYGPEMDYGINDGSIATLTITLHWCNTVGPRRMLIDRFGEPHLCLRREPGLLEVVHVRTMETTRVSTRSVDER